MSDFPEGLPAEALAFAEYVASLSDEELKHLVEASKEAVDTLRKELQLKVHGYIPVTTEQEREAGETALAQLEEIMKREG